MAFLIRCKDDNEAKQVVRAVNRFLKLSRFNLTGTTAYGNDGGIEIVHKGRRTFVSIRGVRLNMAKGYCGNHGGPCLVGGGKRHTKRFFLEGLDWVSWNDMLNDALDSIGHDGDAGSSHCIIRKGRKRRIEYDCGDRGEWDKDTMSMYYVDCIGKVPEQTLYPSGTPGIIGWSKRCVEEPYAEAA